MKPLLILLALAAVAVLGAFAIREDRKRRRLLRAWAHTQGFSLVEDSTRGWERELPAFKLLERGHGRHTSLHLTGEIDGRRVRCLDYRFTTGSGKNRQTHRYGIVVLDTGTPVIPLRIRHEHAFDRIGEFLGFEDIDFESAEFSRKYHVSAADRRWAYDVIHPATIEYLLSIDVPAIEFGYAEIAVFRRGALTAHHCHEDLKVARHLLQLVPADVLAQLRGEKR